MPIVSGAICRETVSGELTGRFTVDGMDSLRPAWRKHGYLTLASLGAVTMFFVSAVTTQFNYGESFSWLAILVDYAWILGGLLSCILLLLFRRAAKLALSGLAGALGIETPRVFPPVRPTRYTQWLARQASLSPGDAGVERPPQTGR